MYRCGESIYLNNLLLNWNDHKSMVQDSFVLGHVTRVYRKIFRIGEYFAALYPTGIISRSVVINHPITGVAHMKITYQRFTRKIRR